MIRLLRTLAITLAITSPALADTVSKEVCIDAHSRGQDAREQNKLSLARKLFLTCAQSSCPSLVQGDCARMADDLSRIQPQINFAARDANGVDLPDTSVFVDDALVTTRLDDGKAYDLDPGRHKVKFVHDGKEQTMSVVVGIGDRGRMVTATFGEPAQAAARREPTEQPKPSGVKRAFGAKLAIGAGTVLAVGGISLGVLGLLQVPDNCSVSTHQCAAPPGDPAFADASAAVSRSNLGWFVGSVGVAALVGGAVWYVKSGKPKARREERVVTPWISPSSAGVALSGRL